MKNHYPSTKNLSVTQLQVYNFLKVEKKDHASSKSKDIGSLSNSSYLSRKKKRQTVIKPLKKDKEEDFTDNTLPEPLNEEPIKEEPLYCFCNGPSHGDMVGCSNESVIKLFKTSVNSNGSILLVSELNLNLLVIGFVAQNVQMQVKSL